MRPRTAALTLAALLTLSGCVSLPSDGPVVDTEASGRGVTTDAMNINPRSPQPGQSAAEVVQGWLDAMEATPIRTTVAREFLSEEARDSWSPTETITYTAAALPTAATNVVPVKLSGAAALDDRGAWQGRLTALESQLSIPMVVEDGQFRISDPPDQLIVPELWFEERFRQVSLYFFDPTAQVLVPDPVFVPRGEQLASALVDGLLAGPAPDLAEHSVNAVPSGLRSAVSVPVSVDGLADVQLTGNPGSSAPTAQDAELLVAQLAWTLRQDPSVERLRVSIEGVPVQVDGETEFSIEVGDTYAPYVADASTLLYGLDNGLMVAGAAQNLDPVSGPFGTVDLGLRTISPDLRAERAAGITTDGSELLLGPVRAGGAGVERPVVGATDLLEPAWDFTGRLWVIDRRADGAVVRYLQGGRMRTLTVPGVSRRDVKLMLVSRDGSRLVAVVRGPKEDVIMVSRLLVDAQGRVVGARPAVPVGEQDGRGLRIRDIAWRSPTSIVVLRTVGGPLFQVRSVTVDGAPTGLDSLSVTLDGHITGLAGTPKPDETVYAVSPGLLMDLSGPSAGTIEIDPKVSNLSYVG